MMSITNEQISVQTKSLTSVIFNDVTNETQICYHLIYPKNFNLIKRPKRTAQSNGGAVLNKRRRRGRPRKEEAKKSEPPEVVNTTEDKLNEHILKIPCSRTRSGRVSRPPKHMSKFVDIKDTKIVNNVVANDIPGDNGLNQSTNEMLSIETPMETVMPETKKVRKNLARFTCSVCKKVYLGRKKLLKHYVTFPDHKTFDSSSHTQASNSSHFDISETFTNGAHSILFDELMKLIGQTLPGERVPTFLTEVSNFVYKIRSLKPKLIHSSSSGDHSGPEYYVDRNVARLLNLPEGRTQLDENAFDEHHLQEKEKPFSTFIDERPINDLSSLSSNLQHLGYNLNLFPPVNYDHISDNAVEAEVLGEIHTNDTINDISHESPILDMNLDLFPFNNIK